MVDNVDKVENTTSDKTGKDITNEVEPDAEDVEIYSIEELVPSSVPITIPYLEIFRTNELEYVPYISPYNVGCSSSSDDSSSSSSDTTTDDTNTETTGETGSATDTSNTTSTTT